MVNGEGCVCARFEFEAEVEAETEIKAREPALALKHLCSSSLLSIS